MRRGVEGYEEAASIAAASYSVVRSCCMDMSASSSEYEALSSYSSGMQSQGGDDAASFVADVLDGCLGISCSNSSYSVLGSSRW